MLTLKICYKNNNTSYTEKYRNHIPCSFACKVVCLDNNFRKPVVFKISEEYNYCKQNIK